MTDLQARVRALASAAETARLDALLGRLLADPGLHARFLNTLSRMEYVGARKIAKSRHADFLDAAGLQHLLEETGHALRLKRAALKLAPCPEEVATYSREHTLAGAAGEGYLQAVDRAAENAVADLAEEDRAECNYLLASAAVEVRAEAFYPVYDDRLQAAGAPFSLASIRRDEARHLAEMGAGLAASLPGWEQRLETVLREEPRAFGAWLDALEDAIRIAEKPAAPAGLAV